MRNVRFIGLGGLLTAALVHGSASWPALMPGLAVIGIGVGLATPILGSVSMSLVPAESGGMAAGAVNTTRQLGFAFGIAALGSVFTAHAQSSLSGRSVPDAAHAAHAIAGGQTPGLLHAAPSSGRQLLDSAAHAAAVTGVQATFAVAGAVGILASLLVIFLMRPARAHAPARTSARLSHSRRGADVPQFPGSASLPSKWAAYQRDHVGDEPPLSVTNLDHVAARLSDRDAVVCLCHERLVAGLVGPATKDMRQAGFATAPAAALAEESW